MTTCREGIESTEKREEHVHCLGMKIARISGRKRVERVLRHGKNWRGKHLSLKFQMGPPDHPNIDPNVEAIYIGVMTPAKLDKSAVRRNRMRRRCREAFRRHIKEGTFPTLQLIIRPSSSSLNCRFADLTADVSTFFSTLRV